MKSSVLIIIPAALIVGFLLPELGRLKSVVAYVIGVLLFFSFLTVDLKTVKLIRFELLVTLILASVIMPLLAWHVLAAHLDEGYRIGVLLVSLAPSGMLMLVLSEFIKEKDSSLIIVNFFATHFSSMLYIPVVLSLLLEDSAKFDNLGLLLQIVILIILPFSLTILFRKVLSDDHMLQLLEIKKKVMPPLIFIIISVSIAKARSEVVMSIDLIYVFLSVISVYLLQGLLALGFSSLFLNKKQRNTLTLVASSRNIQFMLAIGIMNFSPATVMTLVIGIVCHHITNLMWLAIFRERST